MAEVYPEFEKRDAALVAISTDNVLDAKKMAESVGAGLYILADDDTSVARAFSVFDLHGDGVAAPSTFILDQSGEIVAYHVGRDITDRPTIEGILTQLDQMGSQNQE